MKIGYFILAVCFLFLSGALFYAVLLNYIVFGIIHFFMGTLSLVNLFGGMIAIKMYELRQKSTKVQKNKSVAIKDADKYFHTKRN